MTDGRNWYIILELEFYPNPVNDEDVIRERIDEKSKFWSRNANNFQHKEYKDYLENISKIHSEIGESSKVTFAILNRQIGAVIGAHAGPVYGVFIFPKLS